MEKRKRFSSAALRMKYLELRNKRKAATMEYNKTFEERLIEIDNVGKFYNFATIWQRWCLSLEGRQTCYY